MQNRLDHDAQYRPFGLLERSTYYDLQRPEPGEEGHQISASRLQGASLGGHKGARDALSYQTSFRFVSVRLAVPG